MRSVAVILPLLVGAAAWNLPDEEAARYVVKWSGLPVVDATFSLRRGESGPVIDVLAKTRSIPARLYRVENRYVTEIDEATGRPTVYDKVIDEAKFQESLIALYDQDRGETTYRLNGATTRASLPGPTHNLFSALYAVRQHDFRESPEVRFYLDAKGVYWEATAKRARNLRVEGSLVWEVRVTFQKVEEAREVRQSDLLTDNIVRGDEPLTLFVRSSGPPLVIRMEYMAKGFRVVAELEED